MTTAAPVEYRCVVGFDYAPKSGDPLRFEPGDLVVDVPRATCESLAKQGAVEAVTATPKRKPAKAAA